MSHAGIGIDIGGTKILAGAVDAQGQVIARSQVRTPADPAASLVEAILEAVSGLGTLAAGLPVALAVAGRVSRDGRSVVQSANLGLVDVLLADRVEQRLRRRCLVVNDADAALWGEHHLGAARGVADVTMLTIGTGVGGSNIVAGRLVTGAHGAASEVGHTTVKPGGRPCGCGGRGCLDQYGSGRALQRYARRRARQHGTTVRGDEDVLTGAAAGEPYAVAAIEDLATWVGRALATVVALLDPACVVLAGGVVSRSELVTDAVRERLQHELDERGVMARPDVVSAALGADAGMIGAALLSETPLSTL